MVLDTISSEDLLSIFCKLNLNCQLYLKLAKVPVVARGIKKLNFFKLMLPLGLLKKCQPVRSAFWPDIANLYRNVNFTICFLPGKLFIFPNQKLVKT